MIHKIYKVLIKLLYVYFYIGRFFSHKIKLQYQGQKRAFQELSYKLPSNLKPIIWFHCASLGEFEQGWPLMNIWKTEFPKYFILVSFFSPSGFEVKKNDKIANACFYLPIDTEKNCHDLLTLIKPKLVIFIKYEIWPNLITCLYQKQIPFFLISAVFNEHQLFFHPLLSYFRKLLHYYTAIFVQDDNSQKLLNQIGLQNHVFNTGDTRFDRVQFNIETKWEDKKIAHFIGKKPLLIAGSVYEADAEILKHATKFYSEYQLLIAPHDINQKNLTKIASYFEHAVLYSEYDYKKSNVMILDTMGYLSKMYRYADVIYIGGGFNKTGIHNVVEAIGYKKLVVVGPNNKQYVEARDLIACKGLVEIQDYFALSFILREYLLTPRNFDNYVYESKRYFNKNIGASKATFKQIIKYMRTP
ncbi:MAG: glycosyltransferase N-terminal domain-containing protein [Alphaproteobacteria bacterium]|nr:glycosyltransferase N-terminal domain-containing protein [Alphaproteobacteria bacterium]